MGIFKPARKKSQEGDSESHTPEESICDLDVITSQRVTFIFQGKTHALLPITTQVFFEFVAKVNSYAKAKTSDVEKENQAYFETIQVVCPSITLKEVERMTVIQKATLIEGITRKITGNKDLFETSKKKLEKSPSKSLLPN